MPRHPINYDNVCFYKIVCKDLTIKDIYVGHTTDFAARKSQHKNTSKNRNGRDANTMLYKFVFDNGGWDNFDMILIEKTKCDDKLDALKKERKYIEEFNATLNQCIPSRTKKQWEEDNEEHIKNKKKIDYQEKRIYKLDKAKEYYKQNTDKCKEWKNGKTLCECGIEYTNANKARHERSQYHINNI